MQAVGRICSSIFFVQLILKGFVIMATIDRLQLARLLAQGKRVLDIGGQKMEGCDPNSPFARVYALIEEAASEYRIADYQAAPTVDYVIDFNKPESIEQIREAIDQYKPDIILCMEVLEHVNYHYELMNELARSIETNHSAVFITVPNNSNWVFNALGWNWDHSLAFLRDVAYRFVSRSNLGKHAIISLPCMQKYIWYWPVVYLLSFFQPFSWGFLIYPDSTSFRLDASVETAVRKFRKSTGNKKTEGPARK